MRQSCFRSFFRTTLAIGIAIASASAAQLVYASDFSSIIAAFSRNQQSVKTLVARGTLTVRMKSATGGDVGRQMSSEITVFMKYPNLFKLVVAGPAPAVIVQKDNLMSQKISGSGTVITAKVTEESDLFKKYFSYGITEALSEDRVLGRTTVMENGLALTRFVLKPAESSRTAGSPGGSSANPTLSGSMRIDHMELFFDSSNMLVRSAGYSNEKPVTVTELNYTKYGSTYIATTIRTDVLSGAMEISQTIAYTAVSLNTEISEKEFELN